MEKEDKNKQNSTETEENIIPTRHQTIHCQGLFVSCYPLQ